eukprot:3362117-Rhodomonas_salina.3
MAGHTDFPFLSLDCFSPYADAALSFFFFFVAHPHPYLALHACVPYAGDQPEGRTSHQRRSSPGLPLSPYGPNTLSPLRPPYPFPLRPHNLSPYGSHLLFPLRPQSPIPLRVHSPGQLTQRAAGAGDRAASDGGDAQQRAQLSLPLRLHHARP